MGKTFLVTNKIFTQPFIVVGVVLEKDNKFLLIQEGKVDIGSWNIPAGWLDINEDVILGAKREAEEETGLEIEIAGFLGVYGSCKKKNNKIINPVRLIFTAKALTEKFNLPQNEILDAKWFSFEEIKAMKDQLRGRTIIPIIEDYLSGTIFPLEVIKKFQYLD